VQFFIRGDPKPQGSKRHVGRGIMVESSKGLKPWREKIVKRAIEEADGVVFEGPVGIRCVFFIARPQAHYRTGKHAGTVKLNAPRWRDQYPDIEKLLRGLFDGLQTSGLIPDDSHVCDVQASKVYGDPGCLVEVRELA
jgi:crossover junction endodeoxyribonuclease RusA